MGKYSKNKKYEGYEVYEVYILSDNSDYNIFKNDKVEVKYPKTLKISSITKTNIFFFSDDNKISMSIDFSYINKNITIQELIKQSKSFMEANKDSLKYSKVGYDSTNDKMFTYASGNNNKNGLYSELVLDGREVYKIVIVHSEEEIINWDEIIKNIKESFKVF